MSVDTYLKGKNIKPYAALEIDGLRVLVSPRLAQWAESVEVGLNKFLLWKSFDVIVEHRHGPT
ncbi:MAG: hypothetical protein V3R95_02905 [Dehalococcoidia bacterium]